MTDTSRVHEPWIDWLRAFASIAVVIFHINAPRDGSDWYATIVSYGWLGVSIFFVVSGYCVMLSSIDRPPARQFLFKRYIRVLPPYWASLGVVLAVVIVRKVFAGQNDVSALPNDWLGFLATLTLTTIPVTSIPTINWVYWTLSYELAFYGVMAIALISKRLFRGIMIGVTLACVALPFAALNQIAGLFFLDHWPLFACGVGLAEAMHARTRFGMTLLVIATAGIAILEPISSIIAGLLTALTIFLAMRIQGADGRLKSRSALFLGTISYSLYLIHVPVGVYLLGHLFDIQQSNTVAYKVIVDPIIVIGCLVIAYAFNRVIERPAQMLAHRWQRRARSNAATCRNLP